MKPTTSAMSFSWLLLVLMVTFTPAAQAATATCFCKVSKDNLIGATHATGVCRDLTGDVNKTYSGVFPQNDDNQRNCNALCTAKVSQLGLVHNQSVAAACCAIGAPTGSAIGVFSAVGNKDYTPVREQPSNLPLSLGNLLNQPQVSNTTCHCPATWISNTTQVAGGVTTNGQCKKFAGGPIAISPLPTDGTPIGSWGFTWGNGVYAWGSQANGGAPHCVTAITTPAACGLF